MQESESIMCPSHRCKPGSKLLGVRQEDGTVSILPEALAIDEVFIERAKGHEMSPEKRFRFTNKCIEGGCQQWNGKGCVVADRMVEYINQIAVTEDVPRCSIRNTCRWFYQKGSDACKICSYVLTEITEKELEESERK